MPTWTLKADRRSADLDHITDALHDLHESIRGLSVTFLDRHAFQTAADGGDFRDFAPVAELNHHRLQALEIVGEQLIDRFGFQIDFAKGDGTEST